MPPHFRVLFKQLVMEAVTEILEQREKEKTDSEIYMSAAQAGKYIGKDQRTVARYVKDGKLINYGNGKVLQIKKSDLDKFKESKSLRHKLNKLKSASNVIKYQSA